MRDEQALIAIKDRLAGIGTLSRGTETAPVASFTMERPKYDPRGSWRFVAHVVEQHWRDLQRLLRVGAPSLVFEGETDTGRRLRIPRLDWTHQQKGRLKATAQDALLAFDDLTDRPESQFVMIRLTPTPIALPEIDHLSLVNHSNGLIAPMEGGHVREMPVQSITVAGQPFSLALRHVYERVRADSYRSLLQIPLPMLTCRLEGDECRCDLKAFAKELSTGVEDVLRVLSLLSRRFVHWTSIEIDTFPIGRSVWHRAVQVSQRNDGRGQLVNQYRLPAGSIGRLVDTFRTRPDRQSISAAIIYLIAILDLPQLESGFTSAFTALEALVQGLGQKKGNADTIDRKTFDQLARALRSSIRAFDSERKLPEGAVTTLIAKLPEMRRRPIVPRVVEAVADLAVNWDDLWPPGTDLTSALEACYRRRNKFIHQGEFASPRQAFVDTHRIHDLTERMLFRLIGGDPAWQTGREYENAAAYARIEMEGTDDSDVTGSG
jgi:hypothetical protein